jgi:hypothetical protein
VVGTGGVDTSKSAGHGRLIYAMRVDEKLNLAAYCADERFRSRDDARLEPGCKWALVSSHFYYFGRNAIDISTLPPGDADESLEKKGPGFKKHFSDEFIAALIQWIEATYEPGVHGDPCGHGPHTSLRVRMRAAHAGSSPSLCAADPALDANPSVAKRCARSRTNTKCPPAD